MKPILLFIFSSLLFFSSAQAEKPKREIFRGYFVLVKGKLYITQRYHSNQPLYPVEWWDGKKPVPLCAANVNPGCLPVTLNFEPKVLSGAHGKEVVFTKAIFEEEVKAEQRRAKSLL